MNIKILRQNNNFQNKKIFLYSFFISVVFSFLFFNDIHKIFAQQTSDDLKSSITNNKAAIEKLEAEIKEYNQKIANTKGEATTLKQALSNLEAKRKNLQNEISAATYKISLTETTIDTTVKKIENVKSKIELLKSGIVESLRHKSQSNPLDNQVLMALSGKTISDAFNSINSNNEFRENLQNTTSKLKHARTDLEQNKVAYEIQYKELQQLQDSLQDKKSVVEQSKQETDKLLKETKNKEAVYQQQLADKKKKKVALEKEVLDFEAKLKSNVNAGNLPKSGKGILQYPVSKVIITQYFGNTPFSTTNPQVYNGMGHNGVDFGASVGTAIYSAADGVVTGVGNSDAACPGVSFGKWVLVKHNNGLSTLYAHLSSQLVSAGQSVTAGQKIALSGNTGYSTGPHLHFTVYASDGVHVAGPTEYQSKVCGTYMIIPVAPRNAYLNPLTYL